MSKKRTLLSGREVKEYSTIQNITLGTTCPEKYLFVDCETGQVWSNYGDQFREASIEELRELVLVPLPNEVTME